MKIVRDNRNGINRRNQSPSASKARTCSSLAFGL